MMQLSLEQSFQQRAELRRLNRVELERHQLERLQSLLDEVLPLNAFYQQHYGFNQISLTDLRHWSHLPSFCKQNLVDNSIDGLAPHHTFARPAYERLHRTSGTRGRPMIVMDTHEDWQWWRNTWQYVWDAAMVEPSDIVFMAFSFGPFIGFWSAFDAAIQRGMQVVPAGGLTTAARLELLHTSNATVLCCTPTYALHMAEEAARRQIDLRASKIRRIIVAGEPGGSIDAVRDKIEAVWNAKVIDHSGATEVGPWGVGSQNGQDLTVVESEFIAEFAPLARAADQTEQVSDEQPPCELILTALGRAGAPVLRYRTGDIVRPFFEADNGCNFVKLKGGILGRVDDMLIIRGVNVFPSSMESILRQFDNLGEYRITATRDGRMDQLQIEVETGQQSLAAIADAFAIGLGLRVDLIACEANSLPRSDGKAKRFIDLRSSSS